MILAPRYLARPWGNKLVVALQVGMIVSGVLVPVLGALGIIFGLVWVAIWFMRRDVAAKMARGELPSQQTDRLADRE
jgi:flagellar biogenesis protein FliO